MRTQGLHLEQAPPLSIPFTFFVTAALAIIAAGFLLLAGGRMALISNWGPLTLSLTHLGTLGMLSMVMMGALYQMTAVVAGSPVPAVRLAHVVHALLVLGVMGFCWGTARLQGMPVFLAIVALTLAVVLFVVPVGLALGRAPARTATVTGMRAALAAFLLAALLGLWMAHGHAGLRFPGNRALFIQVHLGVALLGWVGGLISAVSWQVLPMFFLASSASRGHQRILIVMTLIGVWGSAAVLVADLAGAFAGADARAARWAAVAVLPALLAVWGLHPLWALRALSQRRRKRRDGTLLFWRAGLLLAPPAAVAAVATFLGRDPHWGLLLGWLALWGWAGMIVHGMLCRIMPFLVWFHRFAPRVGEVPVPSLRSMLPDSWVRRGFALHLGTLLFGVAAILAGDDGSPRVLGLALLATGLHWLACILRVLRQRPPA